MDSGLSMCLSVSTPLKAACDTAHEAGAKVAAHCLNAEGARQAVLAGVDSVEHGHGIDEAVIELMLERGTCLVPTILSDVRIIEHGTASGIPSDVVDKCRKLFAKLERSLSAAIGAGVRIVAGNDGGAPFVRMGDIVDELRLYIDYGLDPAAVLASATQGAAQLLGLEDVGLVEVGLRCRPDSIGIESSVVSRCLGHAAGGLEEWRRSGGQLARIPHIAGFAPPLSIQTVLERVNA